jgi:hypothetical protein
MPRSRTLALIAGGIAALAITGVAMAHPGGIVDRVDVLARALGISSEEVEQAKEDGTLRELVGDLTLNELADAYDAELGDAIDQALADGVITPEQAERLGELDLGGRGFGLFGGPGFGEFDRADLDGLRGASIEIRIDLSAIYADLLGMTEDEFDAAREDGSLRDLIADLDPVAVQAAIVDARDAQIDEALAAGDITQEQADLLRETMIGGFGGPGGFGHFGGHGHGRGGPGAFGRFGGFGSDAPSEDTSAAEDSSASF